MSASTLSSEPAPAAAGAGSEVVRRLSMTAVALAVLALAFGSLFVGVSDVSLTAVLADEGHARDLLLTSRVPRTAAVVLAGACTAVAGVVMQILVRNRFVEPSTTGTTESASLGLLVVTIWAPGMAMAGKITVATGFALAGTALFLLVLSAVPVRSVVTVPLVGIMLGGVIGAGSTYLAFRYDLLQTLSAWLTGDFSGVVSGRYELLWLVGLLTALVYLVADRLTVIGLGKDIATGLGVAYRGVMLLGLALVAVSSAVVVAVVGALPFLGLVVPNVVSLLLGDHLRRSLPWVALFGAGLVLVCDLVGRLVIHPYEIPIGVVMGVLGAVLFLWLLLRRAPDVG